MLGAVGSFAVLCKVDSAHIKSSVNESPLDLSEDDARALEAFFTTNSAKY